ncbi:NAD-dependent epimerase/dehydratase family protein [Nocardia sp. NPDC059091]|uniref:NAD-dependent epimerase/dehydratase family protein n=1 Tax=Nocardia sp. NPDC059091 TaxID=3346724 RepID=UPI0036CD7F76
MNGDHSGQTVLVTGGTGYLAGWVIAGLLQRDYRVRTTVRDLDKAAQVRAAVSEQAGAGAARAVEFAAVDLLRDDGWDEAVAGTDYVLHTASPMPFGSGVDLITTAREGTCRVLGAAARAGVRRAVLTSSGVTADPGDPDTPATEAAWTVPSGTPLRAYPDSKILAERDAWGLAAATGLELTAVLPTFMQGPMLGTSRPGTVDIIRRLLTGKIPAIPNIGWNVVDVRDIAELHILAMTSPAAAGQRYLGAGNFVWYRDIAAILREQLPEDAAKVPTRAMPDILVTLLARWNPQMAMLRPELGRVRLVDSGKARTQLGWHPRPTEQTIIDTATALITESRQGLAA